MADPAVVLIGSSANADAHLGPSRLPTPELKAISQCVVREA